jgi:hypothetical protein
MELVSVKAFKIPLPLQDENIYEDVSTAISSYVNNKSIKVRLGFHRLTTSGKLSLLGFKVCYKEDISESAACLAITFRTKKVSYQHLEMVSILTPWLDPQLKIRLKIDGALVEIYMETGNLAYRFVQESYYTPAKHMLPCGGKIVIPEDFKEKNHMKWLKQSGSVLLQK